MNERQTLAKLIMELIKINHAMLHIDNVMWELCFADECEICNAIYSLEEVSIND